MMVMELGMLCVCYGNVLVKHSLSKSSCSPVRNIIQR